MPAPTSRSTAAITRGSSGALSTTPCEPRVAIRSRVSTISPTGAASVRWNRERMTAGRIPGSSASNAARTPLENRDRGVDDEVHDERPPGQANLRALPVQVLDGLVNLGDRTGPYPAAAVEHAVDGRLRQPGLDRDLADPEGVPHTDIVRGF